MTFYVFQLLKDFQKYYIQSFEIIMKTIKRKLDAFLFPWQHWLVFTTGSFCDSEAEDKDLLRGGE